MKKKINSGDVASALIGSVSKSGQLFEGIISTLCEKLGFELVEYDGQSVEDLPSKCVWRNVPYENMKGVRYAVSSIPVHGRPQQSPRPVYTTGTA